MQTQGFQFVSPGAKQIAPQFSPLQFVTGDSLVPESGVDSFLQGKLQGLRSLLDGIQVGTTGIVRGLEAMTDRQMKEADRADTAAYRQQQLDLEQQKIDRMGARKATAVTPSEKVWNPLSPVTSPADFTRSAVGQQAYAPSYDTSDLPQQDHADWAQTTLENWADLNDEDRAFAREEAERRGLSFVEDENGDISIDIPDITQTPNLAAVPSPASSNFTGHSIGGTMISPSSPQALADANSPIGQWSVDPASGLSQLSTKNPDGSTTKTLWMPDPKDPSVPKLVKSMTVPAADPKAAREEEKYRAELDEKEIKALDKARAEIAKAELVSEDIDRVIDMVEKSGWIGTGSPVAALARKLEGSKASTISRLLNSVKADTAFSTLQEMRQNSPTGGALGAVSEKELALLQSASGAIDEQLPAEELVKNLKRLKERRQLAIEKWNQALSEGAPESTDIPVVRSQADYDALPIGAVYQNERGERGTKTTQ